MEWKPGQLSLGEVAGLPLKPSLVEWKRSSVVAFQSPSGSLKPSLVEWKLGSPVVPGHHEVRLETFLSGMETPQVPCRGIPRRGTLKPSLVEWKQK